MQKNKLLKNISWLFFDKVIRILGGLFVGIWVARYLGPKDFGVLNYAMAYTAFFMLFVKLGLDQIVVREITKKPKLTPYLLGTAFGLKLIGSLVAIGLLATSLYFMDIDTLTKIVIMTISIGFIFQSLDVIDFYFQSHVLSKYVVIARNSAFIVSSLLKVYFIVNEYNVVYFAIASSIDFLLAGLFLGMIYKKTGHSIVKWHFSRKMALKLLKYSWALGLSILLITIHLKVDQIMIGNMLDIEQVGIYSVAVRLSEFWLFFPSIIASTLMPYLVSLRETDQKMYKYRLLQLYSFMFWMGISVGLLTTLFGKDIIVLMFGEAYINAYSALVLNIWAGVFVAQSSIKGIWVISENQQLYRIVLNAIAVVTNILLNILLIPIYGIAGAAFATLVTRFINNWVSPLFIKSYRANTLESIKSVNLLYVIHMRKKIEII